MDLKKLLKSYEDWSFQLKGLTDQQLFDLVYAVKQSLKDSFQNSMNELVGKLDGEDFKTVYDVINKNFIQK